MFLFLETQIVPFVFSFVLFTIAWLIYKKTDNAAIVDVFWPLSVLSYAIWNLLSGAVSLQSAVVVALAGLWALRLTGFLYLYRVKGRRGTVQTPSRYLEG